MSILINSNSGLEMDLRRGATFQCLGFLAIGLIGMCFALRHNRVDSLFFPQLFEDDWGHRFSS
jgi:hypothetical protein